MSTCPKCGVKLHIYNISQFCPKCKTNLMYADFEKKFYREAKLAEMSLANARVKLQKVKTALIGGKLQYVRLASMLLPILALLVPFGSITVSLPVYEKTIAIGALGLYNAFTDGTFTLLGSIENALYIGEAAAALSACFYSLIAAAAAAVLVLLLTILSFISFKKMAAILCAFSLLGCGAGIAVGVFAARITDVGTLISAENGFGVFIMAAAFLVVFVLNVIIVKNGLPITYKEGDIERVEMRKKFRKKEIELDDIPFPIFETEQEREARLEAIAKTEAETAEALGVKEDE